MPPDSIRVRSIGVDLVEGFGRTCSTSCRSGGTPGELRFKTNKRTQMCGACGRSAGSSVALQEETGLSASHGEPSLVACGQILE